MGKNTIAPQELDAMETWTRAASASCQAIFSNVSISSLVILLCARRALLLFSMMQWRRQLGEGAMMTNSSCMPLDILWRGGIPGSRETFDMSKKISVTGMNPQQCFDQVCNANVLSVNGAVKETHFSEISCRHWSRRTAKFAGRASAFGSRQSKHIAPLIASQHLGTLPKSVLRTAQIRAWKWGRSKELTLNSIRQTTERRQAHSLVTALESPPQSSCCKHIFSLHFDEEALSAFLWRLPNEQVCLMYNFFRKKPPFAGMGTYT